MVTLLHDKAISPLRSANYRLKGNSYVVDGLVNHAVLFLGSDGSSRQAEIKFLG